MVCQIVGLPQEALRLVGNLSLGHPIIVLFAKLAKVGVDAVFEFIDLGLMDFLIGLGMLEARFGVLELDVGLVPVEVWVFLAALVADVFFVVRHSLIN